jgi:hypothetical protein
MEGGCVTQKKRNDEYARLTTMKEHEQEGKDDFWTERTPLLTAQFPTYYSEPQKVWGRFHTSEEQYRASVDEEIIPIKEKQCRSANLEIATWKFRLSGSAAWE